jgi:hypothetical protein
MASLTLRSVKGSPLTNNEIDGNFTNLDDDIATRLLATDYNAADVLAKLITVDGTGSGLDADLLDGLSSSTANTASTIVARDAAGNFSAGQITATQLVGPLYLGTADTIVFEGSTNNEFETTITVVNPTADRTITFPNESGTVVLTGGASSADSITTTMIQDGAVTNVKLANSSITIDGNVVSLGGSLTIGAGLKSAENVWTGLQTFRDNKFIITDDSDTTKILAFQLSNIATGTTRTLTIPNESGTIATQGYVQTPVTAGVGVNSQGVKTISSSAPTGGSSGDIWYRI